MNKTHLNQTLLLAGLWLIVPGLAGAASTPPVPLKAVQATDVAGKPVTVPAPDAKATVLLFVSKDCPYSNAASPEMARIAKAYAKKNFDFVFVYGSPYAKQDETAKHADQYGFTAPAVVDNKEALVKATG